MGSGKDMERGEIRKGGMRERKKKEVKGKDGGGWQGEYERSNKEASMY